MACNLSQRVRFVVNGEGVFGLVQQSASTSHLIFRARQQHMPPPNRHFHDILELNLTLKLEQQVEERLFDERHCIGLEEKRAE